MIVFHVYFSLSLQKGALSQFAQMMLQNYRFLFKAPNFFLCIWINYVQKHKTTLKVGK